MADGTLFTPNGFTTTDTQFLETLASKLESATIEKELTDDLFLNKTVESVKQNSLEIVKKIIATGGNEDISNSKIKELFIVKFEENKYKILLGLSYLDKLYSVKYEDYNIKDLVQFRPDFYGNKIDTLDWLISLGTKSKEELLLDKNSEFFSNNMKSLGQPTLVEFLDMNRQVFSTTLDSEEWFKNSTKAFIVEESSSDLGVNTKIYHRLKSDSDLHKYILPLLNMKEESVYIVSNSLTIIFGNYGRMIDENIRLTDKVQYEALLASSKELVKSKAKNFERFNQILAGIVGDDRKSALLEKVTEVWTGYNLIDSENGKVDLSEPDGPKRRWALKNDISFGAIEDFFGPVGRYYSHFPTNPSAYALHGSNKIYFDAVDIHDHFGSATLSHELVHIYDRKAILGGNGYRPEHHAEAYAMGLFESTTSPDIYNYGFNTMFDFKRDRGNRGTTNTDPYRVNSKENIQSYMKGLMDVTYLIDGLEAESILTLSDSDKKYFFNKIGQTAPEYSSVEGVSYLNKNDIISNISEEEWRTLQINNIGYIVRNNLISKNSGFLREKEYFRDNGNNYYNTPLFYPIYAGLYNSEGSSGGLMFRRHAFEMLAEFGWDNGFVKYASDILKRDAHPSGIPLTDEFVFEQIFNGRYTNYTEFKVAQYEDRMRKKDSIKDIVVRYNNVDYTINDGASLQNLLKLAVDRDLAKMKNNELSFERESLKREIIKAFNEKTEGFTSSIFQ